MLSYMPGDHISTMLRRMRAFKFEDAEARHYHQHITNKQTTKKKISEIDWSNGTVPSTAGDTVRSVFVMVGQSDLTV
jgi:hypothetical protein